MAFDIPILVFITFFASSISMAIIGLIRNPQIPALVAFAGVFLLVFSISTDNIIIGYNETNSTSTVNSSGNVTQKDNVITPDVYQFTELPKALFGMFATILILAGALMIYKE